MNKEDLIKYLKFEIECSEEFDEDPKEKDWGAQTGVLLSKEEAEYFLSLIQEEEKETCVGMCDWPQCTLPGCIADVSKEECQCGEKRNGYYERGDDKFCMICSNKFPDRE